MLTDVIQADNRIVASAVALWDALNPLTGETPGMYYFEDCEAGWSETYGSESMTEDGIIAFAEQFDPQPMHTDPEAAAETQYGGLIASGLHTVAVAMRLWVDSYLDDTANMGARYLSELGWHEPVRPDDTLRIEGEPLATETPDHTDTHGYVDYELTAHVGSDAVMTMVSDLVVGQREADR